mmetsp:Transcript_11190/g.17170  ORF Transcript_11190/g.17170 Transcript_11190/m.17170 type:complete len:85 (-) Transcript_11190:146-400(-)
MMNPPTPIDAANTVPQSQSCQLRKIEVHLIAAIKPKKLMNRDVGKIPNRSKINIDEMKVDDTMNSKPIFHIDGAGIRILDCFSS